MEPCKFHRSARGPPAASGDRLRSRRKRVRGCGSSPRLDAGDRKGEKKDVWQKNETKDSAKGGANSYPSHKESGKDQNRRRKQARRRKAQISRSTRKTG